MSRENQKAERDKLSAVAEIQSEMSAHVRVLASPAEPGESVKACIVRVSRRTGLKFNQIKRLWYGEWRIVPTHISDTLRKAVEAQEQQIGQQIRALQERQSRLYALTHHSHDREFYSARAAGPGDRADVDIGEDR